MEKNKKVRLYQTLYYTLLPILYIVTFYTCSYIIYLLNNDEGVLMLGYIFLFVVSPVISLILMRFSMLKWYVDPFAASEIPLAHILYSLIKRVINTKSLYEAFKELIWDLTKGDAMNRIYFLGIFLFAILCSFSIKRKNEQSFLYRILS